MWQSLWLDFCQDNDAQQLIHSLSIKCWAIWALWQTKRSKFWTEECTSFIFSHIQHLIIASIHRSSRKTDVGVEKRRFLFGTSSSWLKVLASLARHWHQRERRKGEERDGWWTGGPGLFSPDRAARALHLSKHSRLKAHHKGRRSNPISQGSPTLSWRESLWNDFPLQFHLYSLFRQEWASKCLWISGQLTPMVLVVQP